MTGPMTVTGIQIDSPSGVATGVNLTGIPWLETINTGDDLVLTLGGAVQVSGQIIYTVQ